MRFLIKIICFVIFSMQLALAQTSMPDYTQYIDPFIGTQWGGNTFPGAAVPFGMVKVGPDCGELKANMGYHYKGKVRGFSHTHLSGTGGGAKYGNVLIYPYSGESRTSGYGSDRGKEKASTGYFSVELTEENVLAELTSSAHAAVHRYAFSKPGESGILIDAGSFLGKNSCCFEAQELVGSEITIRSDTEIAGHTRVRGGWNTSGEYTIYFYAVFDRPAIKHGTWKEEEKREGNNEETDTGLPVGAWFSYDFKEKTTVEVKVGISWVSAGRAKENCLKEVVPFTFDQIVDQSRSQWNEHLGRIAISTKDEEKKTIFYTALYHAMMQPTDRTGENPLWNSQMPHYDDFYTIWDTFRTNHPLLSLIAPQRQAAIVNALLDIYVHEGHMPDARSGNHSGRTQGGSNCDMMVAEAILKDLPGVDHQLAWEAMTKNAEVPPGGNGRLYGRGGLTDYINRGFVSTEHERAGNRTVEYAANDWSLALCAKKLGKMEEYQKYFQRAANWENLWKPIEHDGAKGFIMPRKADGSWDEDYRNRTWKHYTDVPPRELMTSKWKDLSDEYLSEEEFTVETEGSWPNFFYEGHSWTYSLYVPHDVKALMEKCGGKEAFITRLDTFFDKGHYDIGNEPGFLTHCLYIYAGRHDKTAQRVKKIRDENYKTGPKGIPGNDDSGAMSAWYVFQAMGFFPNAGQDVYFITTPLFEKSVLSLGEGKTFTIEARGVSEKNIYIKKAELNGRPWNKAWFRHGDVVNGAKLVLYMGSKPADWGNEELPPSRSEEGR